MREFDFGWLYGETVGLHYPVIGFDFDWLDMEYSASHDRIRRVNKYAGFA